MTANDSVIERLQESRPMLIGVGIAGSVIHDCSDVTVLHAGPPLEQDQMNGPMRGAVVGALHYEGFTRAEAENLLTSGRLDLRSCHESSFVGPVAGIVTKSMPVWIVEDATYGNRAYATFNEGLGKTLRYGANDDDVIRRLRWMEKILAPLIRAALERHGPLDLKTFMAEALRRGDELHNRNKSATAMFVREFAQHMVAVGKKEDVESTFDFLRGNDHFFLNISIASSKCSADAAQAIKAGSVVTAMTANGREFAIRVSGLANRWVKGPPPPPRGRYFEGYSERDAAIMQGDSAISEVVGLGGFSMAAAPAIASFVGGEPSEFARWTERMYAITVAEHGQYRIASLDYRGAPLGIDVVSVVEKGILPVFNGGIAHREPGVGQIGAGIFHPPMECFRKAYDLLEDEARQTLNVPD